MSGPATGLHADAVHTLERWAAPSASQEALRQGYLDHLRAHPDGCWRSGPAAHLTASCLVLDQAGEQTLLVLHRRGGFWVQPGGHLELSDRSLADAALREGCEETGLTLRLLPDGDPQPLDLDRHALSSRFGRCREHLDVAFVAQVCSAAVPRTSNESDAVAWWPVDELPAGVVADLEPRTRAASAAVQALTR